MSVSKWKNLHKSDKIILNKIEKYSSFYKHPSYYLERKLINALQRTHKQEAISCLNAINILERAKLADSPLRSTKNSLIGSCTLFTRAAIESNVPPEESFSHSDVHILEIERFSNIKALQSYEYTMLDDYLKLIEQYKIFDYSHPTTKIVEYIHENITEPIKLDVIAEKLGKSKTYICTHFKQEVGMSIIDYANFHKVEESKYFLKYATTTIAEVAFMFNFCNPGYYSKIFKKYVSMTPKQFKDNPDGL